MTEPNPFPDQPPAAEPPGPPTPEPDLGSYWTDQPSPVPAPAGGPAKQGPTLKTWIGAAVVAFLIGGAAVAVINRGGTSSASTSTDAAASTNAATGGNGSTGGRAGRGTFGTIASIDGTTLTITGSDGSTTTTVLTDDSTVVTTRVTLSLGDVAVGDQVSVMGTTTGTDVAAERIVDNGTDAAAATGGPFGGQPPTDGQAPPADGQTQGSAPGSGQGPAGGRFGGLVRGSVTAVNGSTLTVAAEDGTTYTVTASSTTTVTRMQTGSMADLAVGDEVSVVGATGSDGKVTATRISEGAGGFGFGPGGPGAGGTPPTTN